MNLEKHKIDYIYGSYQVDQIEYSKSLVEQVANKDIELDNLTKSVDNRSFWYVNNFVIAYEYWLSNMLILSYTELREEHFIKLHKLMMSEIDNKNAGEYRTVCAVSSGARKLMPVPMKLPYIMGDIFYDIENHDGTNILDFAVDIHFRIIDAYPFVEKNKDMARFILNSILISSKTIKSPMIFSSKDTDIYKEIQEDEDLITRKIKLVNLIKNKLEDKK